MDKDFVLNPKLEREIEKVWQNMRKKFPDDEKLRSKSSFVNHIFTQVGKLCDIGYDFKNFEDDLLESEKEI